MERTVPQPPSAVTEAACVVCSAELTRTRCDGCGAPVAPGGYRVLRRLAEGPFSRVFLAEKNGQRVALKELLFAVVPTVEAVDRFEREAALLARLDHPNIPRLVDSFREGDGPSTRLYLAQQFVEGQSLEQLLDGQRLTEAEARALAGELLRTLAYLHGRSPAVIHRDLKPANVLRTPGGQWVLVDFGAARDLLRGVTHQATVVGTYGYMAPEQHGGTVDSTADLYALGATLLHALSGRHPSEFLDAGGLELDFEGQLPLSAAMAGFLRRLLARDRTARFQSAADALAALDEAQGAHPVAAPSARRQSRLRRTIAAVALALGIVGVGPGVVLTLKQLDRLERARNRVTITSEPSGAMVSMDGRPMGATPQQLTGPVLSGAHVFTVHRDGYRDAHVARNVKGDNGTVHVVLEPLSR